MSCFSNHLKADLRRNNMWSNQNSQGWRIRLWTLYEDHSPMFLVHIQIFIPPTSCELLVPVFWDQPGGLQPATVKNRRLFRDIFRLTSENFWVGWHSRNFDKSGDWVGCTPNPNVGPPMGKFLYKAHYIKYQVRGTPLVVPWISLLNIVTFYKPRFLHFFLKNILGSCHLLNSFFPCCWYGPQVFTKKRLWTRKQNQANNMKRLCSDCLKKTSWIIHKHLVTWTIFLWTSLFQQEFLWFFGTWFPYMPWDFSFGSWRIWHFWSGSSYLLRKFPPNQSIFNSQHLQHNIGLHKLRRQRLYFRPWCGMGGKTSKDALKGARRRASLRAGALQVSGRYHHFPRKLEDDYILSETVLGCGGALEGQFTYKLFLYCTYTYSLFYHVEYLGWIIFWFQKMQQEHNLAGQIGAPDWLHSCRAVAVHR